MEYDIRDYIKTLRINEKAKKEQSKRLFDDWCVQLNRKFIRLVRNNAKSAINWEDYQ